MGKPLFDKYLTYCVRCCLPETVIGIKFDERGICNGCNSSEEKMHIDWDKRHQELKKKLAFAKEQCKDRAHNCIVPVSGGKDSFFQTYILTKKYGMTPLAVTFNHNWYTEVGKRNLQRLLETFDVDHIMYTPKRSLVNRLARKSIEKIGDSCWHCHAGIGAFTLQIAVKFKIPMVVWGESAAEDGCQWSYYESIKKDIFDEKYFVKISAKQNAESMVDNSIPLRELEFFQHPSTEEYNEAGIVGLHLGDYMFWDDERQEEFIKKEFGWEEDEVEGTYKRYKSVECKMVDIHDYTKFIKRGYGRATDHAVRDVRAGIMTREEAFDIINKIDPKRPSTMDHFLKITGMSEDELIEKIKALRDGSSKKLP